jgi:hypothetical protein
VVSPSVCKRWTKQQSLMPDQLRSPIKHHLVLHRIGTNGQELVEVFDTVRYPWRPRRGASPRTYHRPL